MRAGGRRQAAWGVARRRMPLQYFRCGGYCSGQGAADLVVAAVGADIELRIDIGRQCM